MMCAGVQNVSRPIDMCHEISHGPPIIPHTTPATMHQIVHGTDSTLAPTPAPTRAEIGGLAMCCPKGIDCPIANNSSAATTCGIFITLPRVYTAPPFLQTSFRPTTILNSMMGNSRANRRPTVHKRTDSLVDEA